MTTTPDDWSRPPVTSLAIILGLTGVLVPLFMWLAGLGALLVPVVVTGLLFALGLGLVEWDRWQVVGRFLASLLTVPLALALVATGLGAVGLAAVSGQGAPLFTRIGWTVSLVAVALGCLAAVSGAAVATRGLLDPTRTRALGGIALRTGVPLVVATALSVAYGRFVAFARAQSEIGDVLLLDPLLAPVPGQTHVGLFCGLLGVTALLLDRAVNALPVEELIPATEAGRNAAAAVGRVRAGLQFGGAGAFVLGGVIGAVELGGRRVLLRESLPPSAYDFVVTLTTATALRRLCWWVAVSSVAVVLLTKLVRRLARSTVDRTGLRAAPYVGGAVVAVAAVVAAPAVLTRVVVVALEPSAPGVARSLSTVAAQSGAGAVLLLTALALVGTAMGIGYGLWTAFSANYLPERTAGVSLAAVGLFVASTFVATLDAPGLLVLAGLVAAIVVWDTGSFGTALRREVGPDADSRRLELTHTGGTAAVGGVGVALSLGVLRLTAGPVSGVTETASVGILAAVVAVVALVVALR